MIALPAWSYTALDTFETCPRKYYHRFILKEKEPETEASRKGAEIHKALEDRLKGKPLPENYARFNPMAESIIINWRRGMKMYTELKLGMTREFEPCGFFDKDVWARAVPDVVLKDDPIAILFDWKTGKVREKELQLAIQALFVFRHFPSVDRVVGCNLWLEPNEVGTPYVFLRDQMQSYWLTVLTLLKKMEAMAATGNFVETPGPLCGWCPVKACQFNRS